jgi:hypothetical protein
MFQALNFTFSDLAASIILVGVIHRSRARAVGSWGFGRLSALQGGRFAAVATAAIQLHRAKTAPAVPAAERARGGGGGANGDVLVVGGGSAAGSSKAVAGSNPTAAAAAVAASGASKRPGDGSSAGGGDGGLAGRLEGSSVTYSLETAWQRAAAAAAAAARDGEPVPAATAASSSGGWQKGSWIGGGGGGAGGSVGGGADWDDGEGEVEFELLEEALHWHRYANAIYGWPMFMWSHRYRCVCDVS